MTETVSLKNCYVCGGEQHDHDKFCRRCGTRQANGYATSANLAGMSECETKPLEQGEEIYPTYSGQLIRIVAQGLSARAATQRSNRGLQRLICTLITIPIWMLIVVLSPLDAYTAAKAAAGCVSNR
ncbi:MAG: hypothetical protein ABI977_21920 [Acidobacteriota bacterium]